MNFLIAALLPGLALVSSLAQAQTYPSKPVRIISPYSPGGLGDLLPRAVGAGLTELLGQQVIVENRPGASQIIGMQVAAKSPPDGYTLVFGSVTSLAINPTAHKSLPYEATIWFGILAPAGTPPAIVTRLSQDINKVLAQARIREQFSTVEVTHTTPEGFASHIAREIPKWRKVIQDAKIVME